MRQSVTASWPFELTVAFMGSKRHGSNAPRDLSRTIFVRVRASPLEKVLGLSGLPVLSTEQEKSGHWKVEKIWTIRPTRRREC